MIKKLIKYGNSNALVIDRAILELLNIREGATLKLHTNGTSLIITPTESINDNDLAMSGTEMMTYAARAQHNKMMDAINIDPVKKNIATQWEPGTENFKKLTVVFAEIMGKYSPIFTKLSSKEFMDDADVLAEKYHHDKSSPDYLKELLALRVRHAPECAEMDREMAEAKKALGMPEDLDKLY